MARISYSFGQNELLGTAIAVNRQVVKLPGTQKAFKRLSGSAGELLHCRRPVIHGSI